MLRETNNFVIQNENSALHKSNEQKVLLRKLQNLQNEVKDPNITWNEILANLLVSRIKTYSTNDIEKERNDFAEKPEENFWTKTVSSSLLFFKRLIYDPIFKIKKNTVDSNHSPSTEGSVTGKTDIGKRTITDEDPKSEVELIDPKYHGKIEERTESNELLEVCNEGFEKDEEGNCKASKFILYIPSQCPIGYRRDRLGFCRIMF